MYITISKAQLIDILKNEPVWRLSPGLWFAASPLWNTPLSSGLLETCPRCAVGAVLAKVLEREMTARELVAIAREYGWGTTGCGEGTKLSERLISLAKASAKKNPLLALNAYFEGLAEIISDEVEEPLSNLSDASKSRLTTGVIAFVEEHFPQIIEINTNPASHKREYV
jgi:hypothetical protein